MNYYLLIAGCTVLGFIVGCFVHNLYVKRKRCIGDLLIYSTIQVSELVLELDKDIPEWKDDEIVWLRVKNNPFNE